MVDSARNFSLTETSISAATAALGRERPRERAAEVVDEMPAIL